MLRKFRIFFLDIYLSTGAILFGYSRHSQDMYYTWHIYFGYLDIKHFIYLCMLRKFRIFLGHLPEHPDCFFPDIPDTPRTCITFGIFILNISDIQQLIYLCTFSWCSGSSACFSGHCPQHQGCFFRIFRTLPGYVSHLTYLFRIFRTLTPHLFVHAPEVPHF